MEIMLATANSHKKEEISAILTSHTIILPAEKFIPFEYHETGSTFLENAFGKAEALYSLSEMATVADDSGLVIPALDGKPGIHSARFGQNESGTPLSAEEKNMLVLDLLKSKSDRKAYYLCCAVLILERERFFIIQESFHGSIAYAPAGTGGFGYDPIFYLEEYGETAAQIPAAVKNRISHRAKAFQRLEYLLKTELR